MECRVPTSPEPRPADHGPRRCPTALAHVDGDRLADAAIEAIERGADDRDHANANANANANTNANGNANAKSRGCPARGDLLSAVERLAQAGDPACRAYVRAVSTLPAWAKPKTLEYARRLSLSVGVPIGIVLLLGGLPEVYAVDGIAGVLERSGRLHTMTWRRVVETARFVRDVHGPGGLRPGGEGLRAIARIRLVHAMVRRRLGPGPDGRPRVAQHEMAFTLYAHSHLVRRGLGRLGVKLTVREAAAHQHLWRLVGHFMGVQARYLSSDPAGEAAQYENLRVRLVDGRQAASGRLVASTLGTATQQSRMPRGLVESAHARLVGRELAQRFGIRAHRGWRHAVSAIALMARGLGVARRVVPGLTSVLVGVGNAFAAVIVAADPGKAEPLGAAAARDCARLLASDTRGTARAERPRRARAS